MKATALLKEQHAEVLGLLRQLMNGTGRSSSVLEKLAVNLVSHMVIEQELFYPAVLKVKEDLVLEGYEEHAVARFALKRLMKTSPTDRTFKAKVKTLKEIIEDHIEEEEKNMFPKAEKELKDRSQTLCAEMKVLFKTTIKAGYEQTVSSRGAAVTSALAPTNA